MSSKLTFKKRAVDCAARAATVGNDHARGVWREMEKYWRMRAEEQDDTPLVPEPPAETKPDGG